MNHSKILGMSQKTFFGVLILGGGILVVWASSRISIAPLELLMPLDLVVTNHKWIVFYRILQVIGVITVFIGSFKAYKNYKR